MKKVFKVAIITFVFLCVSLGVLANENNLDVYEEPIFEFEQDYVVIEDTTELKIKTNLEFKAKDIVWSVSDDSIAEIANGKIKPKNNGRVTVTATYTPLNIKATCIVDVKYVIGKVKINLYTHTYHSLKITISQQKNATHYEILRSTSKNGKYRLVATVTSTSYIDKNLTCGTTYYYKVRAINKNNNVKGKYSDIKYRRVFPGKMTITAKRARTFNSNYIAWNKLSGSHGYIIFRSDSQNGRYIKVGETTSTSYIDKNLRTGKTYYYKVRAYRIVSKKRVYGLCTEAFGIKPMLGRPMVKINQYGSYIRINITKVKDASGYEIYKSNQQNGKYSRVGYTNKLVYNDSKIVYEATYYYKIRAYSIKNGKRIYSDYTNPICVNTKVPAPTTTVSRYNKERLRIGWTVDSKCSGYEIYISENGIDYKVLRQVEGNTLRYCYTTNLAVNQRYYIKTRGYKIINGEKVYGNYSKTVTYYLNQFFNALKLKTDYNVRSAASGSYKSVGTVKKEQIVLYYGSEGNYYRIKLNNKWGYIHKSYVISYKDANVLGLSNINQFSNQGGSPLPMGCEVTSLAVVLRYLGFNSVTKNILADKYQPMGKVGYTDPNVAFVGTPYSSKPYGCYAPVIVKTANNYFNAIGNCNYQVNNLTGINIDNLYTEIDKGNPLIMWITYGKPYHQESWVLKYGTKTTKEGQGQYKFVWYGLQHCVAVAGYNKKKNTLIIADVGCSGELTEYSISELKAGYNKLGKQIVSITPNN